MPPRRKRSCPFSSTKKRFGKKKDFKGLSTEAVESLAQSDLGSYYNQSETWPVEVQETATASASHLKIDGGEHTARRGVEVGEDWRNIDARSIICGERLQNSLEELVLCRFCGGDVTIMENTAAKQGLGSTWIVKCASEDCPSQSTTTPFHTTERGKGFDINRAFALGMRTIGRGHAAASKICSFLGLKPVNKSSWFDHAQKIEEEAKDLLEMELNNAAKGVKELKLSMGELTCTPQELQDHVVDAGITIDGSWSSRGWSATDAVVAAISVDTGKVLNVIHMNSLCPECKKMDQKRSEGQVNRLEYLTWFTNHESKCYLNHEGSSAVSLIFFLHQYIEQ